MSMKVFIINEFVLMFFIQLIFGDQIYHLKEIVYTSSRIIHLNELIDEKINLTNSININDSIFYSNNELCIRLKNAGLKDFVLIGQKVKIEFVRQFSKIPELTDMIISNCPGTEINKMQLEEFNFGNNFKIKGLNSVFSNNTAIIRLSYLGFSNTIGILTNAEFNFKYEKPAGNIISNNIKPVDSKINNEDFFLQNFKNNRAELVYRNGGIVIITDVVIRKKLDEENYLVENIKSGKILKVKSPTNTFQ